MISGLFWPCECTQKRKNKVKALTYGTFSQFSVSYFRFSKKFMDKSTRWSSSSCLVLNYGSFQRVSSLIQNSLSRSILFALSTGTRAKTMKHGDTSFARCFTTVSVRDMAHITAAKFRNKATLYTFLWHNRSITNGIALGSKPISRYISLVCYYIVYTHWPLTS